MLHLTGDYRLQSLIARLCDFFESKELNSVRRIRRVDNFAHAITKRKVFLQRKLNEMLSEGFWSVNTFSSCVPDSKTWG